MQDDKSNLSPGGAEPSNLPSADGLQPAVVQAPGQPPDSQPEEQEKPSRFKRFIAWLADHKKISIPALILLVIIILALVPWSRYKVAGLVISKDVKIKVMDLTAGTPVSGARVSSGSINGLTDGNGVAVLHLPVGPRSFTVTKKYYADRQISSTVPIKGAGELDLQLIATGRQVSVAVKDLLSGKTLSDVNIDTAGVSAKTDSSGKALLVVPDGLSQEDAKLSLNGYNDAEVSLKISSKKILENDINLTPSGKIYFLSKRTGVLDVMKANLDGTDPKVVLAGTGQEQIDSTAFSQSPDGKYAVLEARRETGDKVPQLYILSTSDDSLLTFDSGNFDFSIAGWSGDNIIYTAINRSLPDWQSGKQKVKSYDAATGKTTVLDSSDGTDAETAAGEVYDTVYIAANKIVFGKYWASDNPLDGRKNTIISVNPDGQSKQTVASYDAAKTSEYVYQYAPNSFYIEVDDSSGASDPVYYDYTVGGTFRQADDLTSEQIYDNPLFYFSPQKDKTYWSESRDGQETLITANSYGSRQSQKSLATGYWAAGWYTQNYFLATNADQSKLYVLSASGKPVFVTSYQSTYIY